VLAPAAAATLTHAALRAGAAVSHTQNNRGMKQDKYLKTLLEGSGHLNQFPSKINEKGPDYGGYLKIDGKFYRISAWVKEKKGKKFLSIRAIESDFSTEVKSI